jgi:hypothetical protein
MNEIFKNEGYHRDFYVNGKYVGFHRLETYNGKCGYLSKQNFTAEEDILIQKTFNKIYIIKAGKDYTTQITPLCGRIIGDRKQKLDLLANSRLNF